MKELTAEEKKLNKERYLSLLLSLERDGVSKAIDWLESTDFFTAPASINHHGSSEGYLVQHHLNVFTRLMQLQDGDTSKVQSCIIAALTHDWCKINCYKIEWKNKKVYSDNGSKSDAAGRFDWQTVPGYAYDAKLPLGHGEKSLYLAAQFFKLTDEEALAIRWHMSGWDDTLRTNSRAIGNAREFGDLIVKLQIADQMAAGLDEED